MEKSMSNVWNDPLLCLQRAVENQNPPGSRGIFTRRAEKLDEMQETLRRQLSTEQLDVWNDPILCLNRASNSDKPWEKAVYSERASKLFSYRQMMLSASGSKNKLDVRHLSTDKALTAALDFVEQWRNRATDGGDDDAIVIVTSEETQPGFQDSFLQELKRKNSFGLNCISRQGYVIVEKAEEYRSRLNFRISGKPLGRSIWTVLLVAGSIACLLYILQELGIA